MNIQSFILSTCSTCSRILSEVKLPSNASIKDIKTNAITEKELELMARLAGGYEPLFSRVALKYKSMGLKDKTLTEADYKKLILEEYTFLKRPVFIIDNKRIFIGNSKSTIEAFKNAISAL